MPAAPRAAGPTSQSGHPMGHPRVARGLNLLNHVVQVLIEERFTVLDL